MQSAYDAYLANHRSPQLVQSDEFGFFDRVKKYLDDRTTYTEFLKLLNLFTQEIIDVGTLLEKSLLFFGQNDELVGQFKDLVGWDPIKDGRIAGEDWIIDNEPVLERPGVQLHLMKSFGPSYRKLPDSVSRIESSRVVARFPTEAKLTRLRRISRWQEIDLACSGRDALEWSVLNDEWVAFATWASEGSSAHRKNPYEEALYNSEQERHWYSFHITSNLRTIAHLEPVAARIAAMNAEERLAFKLEDGLGGTSPSVYERIIRKVYGKDHGSEILQALYDNPAVAVPIVLSRLKQKDEEWKRAEKEWNKVWREVVSWGFFF
jgi:paired amphipathic helix protein Sin3a